MGIFIWDTAPSKIFVWWSEVSSVRAGDTKVRPVWPGKDYLCFTAETAWSTVKLTKTWSPSSVTLETSTDWQTWAAYTINNTITLTNVWDKVYWRNTSGTTTWFSLGSSNYYQFVMTWSISASGEISSLINKNLTDFISGNVSFNLLFKSCTSLTVSPKISISTLTQYCFYQMFMWCTNLESLPKLSAATFPNYCCREMFRNCSKIKISSTKTWSYQTSYRIPAEWTWTVGTNSLNWMLMNTWWTFTWTPTINTTYYTSNTVV